MVSQDQASKVVKNKDHLYKAFVRNGFFLPVNPKNTFVSKKMLLEMYDKKCFCPKYSEMNFLPCSDPPSASILRDELVKVIEDNDAFGSEEHEKRWKRLAKHMKKNIPER